MNKKCPKQKQFSTSKVGRIVRNVMSNFEFNHTENNEEIVVKYEKKVNLLMENYKASLKYKCSKCNKDNMTAEELKDHLMNECDAQQIKCKYCDVTLSRKEFNDPSTHTCVQTLKQKLDDEIKARKEAENKLAVANRKNVDNENLLKRKCDIIKNRDAEILKLKDDMNKEIQKLKDQMKNMIPKPKEEPKPKVEGENKEEEDVDMGGLFGDDDDY